AGAAQPVAATAAVPAHQPDRDRPLRIPLRRLHARRLRPASVDPRADRGIAPAMASTAFDVRSEEGLSRMIDAALGGDAEALHRMAVLAGCGAGIPLNWPAAFEALRRAAGRGHPLAKAELALLSRFDPAALLAPAPAHALRESPRIRACPAFLDAALCDWIVERARPRMELARTY